MNNDTYGSTQITSEAAFEYRLCLDILYAFTKQIKHEDLIADQSLTDIALNEIELYTTQQANIFNFNACKKKLTSRISALEEMIKERYQYKDPDFLTIHALMFRVYLLQTTILALGGRTHQLIREIAILKTHLYVAIEIAKNPEGSISLTENAAVALFQKTWKQSFYMFKLKLRVFLLRAKLANFNTTPNEDAEKAPS